MQRIFSLFLLLLLLMQTSCQLKKEPPQSLTDQIEQIRLKFAPDKRTAVFSIDYQYADGKWYIKGESSVPDAVKKVQSLVAETFTEDEYQLNFRSLPLAEFADTTRALVKVSVGNLRRTPKHAAEMVDQVVMGMELKLLKTERYWYLVQTPYNYIGWITRGTIERLSDKDYQEWSAAAKYTLDINFAQVFEKPAMNSQVISDLVLGTIFLKKSEQKTWSEIVLPDQRIGFVKTEYIIPYIKPSERSIPSGERIVQRARKMMGIPYLWGGNSTKGMDCSGFTGTVFRSEGYQLPRDANMQVKLGDEIIADETYSNILPGDLIFFGPPDRITHVGICLGGSYFIHCSGDVHVNSLEEEDDLYNPYRKRTLRHFKRIINH